MRCQCFRRMCVICGRSVLKGITKGRRMSLVISGALYL